MLLQYIPHWRNKVKRIFGILFCVAECVQAAPIIFDEPVRVTGGGLAYMEVSGPATQSALNVSFGGGGSGAEPEVFVQYAREFAGLGGSGGVFAAGGHPGINFAVIDGFSSPFFSYTLARPGGILMLFDSSDDLIASVPIIGYHYVTTRRTNYTPTHFLEQYTITILPTPEPGTWLLISSALLPLWLLRRRSKGLPLARRQRSA
jgi:hypothetical protein